MLDHEHSLQLFEDTKRFYQLSLLKAHAQTKAHAIINSLSGLYSVEDERESYYANYLN